MLKQKRKVVISLHGINTTGLWQKEVAPVISQQGWIYYPLDYGNFSPLQYVQEAERAEPVPLAGVEGRGALPVRVTARPLLCSR